MVKVLVVDDSVLDRRLAGAFLEEHGGWVAAYAEDGRAALSQIQLDPPDLVLTDLQMPEINGLELVEAICRDFPHVPVILMTAHGSEEVAVAALRKGAASYVPKRDLARDLVQTVENVLKITKTNRDQRLIQEYLVTAEFSFVLANDIDCLPALIGHLQDQMSQRNITDENGRIRVGTALYEALLNAIEHGNLELNSRLRETGDGSAYRSLGKQRRQQSPYRDRRVRLKATFSPNEAIFAIRDEGAGYDPSKILDPTDAANVAKSSGRGLFLVRMFMDDVRFNDRGNEIVLIKRRS
jgi:CheY-like chemotaxis protein/anti-sigma regulatory factor (Ser/Thr protein kinase)